MTNQPPPAGTYSNDLDQLVKTLNAAVEPLASLLQHSSRAPAQLGHDAQRTSFGYDLLGFLLARPGPNGRPPDTVVVEVNRSAGGRATLVFPDGNARGTHVEVQGRPPAGPGTPADPGATVSITAAFDKTSLRFELRDAKGHIEDEHELVSILVLDGKDGPVVAIGPRTAPYTAPTGYPPAPTATSPRTNP